MTKMLQISRDLIAKFLIYPYTVKSDLKTSPSTVYLIDYFDWLRVIFLMDSTHQLLQEHTIHINDISYYSDLYRNISDVMLACNNPYSIESVNLITSRQDKLRSLLEGYIEFTKEIEVTQQRYLAQFEKNVNNNLPYLFIPFSYAINKLASFHVEFDSILTEDPQIGYLRGRLEDSCSRTGSLIGNLDITIATYSCNPTEDYNSSKELPKHWTLFSDDSKASNTKKSQASFFDKMNYVMDVYSQYKFVGFSNINDGKDTFLLNYPFLQKRLQLSSVAFRDNKSPVFIPIEATQKEAMCFCRV